MGGLTVTALPLTVFKETMTEEITMTAPFRGVFPIPVTPFTEQGAVDEQSFERVLDYCLSLPIDGLCYPANASEVSTLTVDERIALAQTVLRRVGGRVPVIIGVSHPDIQVVSELARHAREHGADAVLYSPAAGDLTEVMDRTAAALEGVDLPVMLQNAPRPVGAGLDSEGIARMIQQLPAIAYVKEETMPSGQHTTRLLRESGPTLRGVFGGDGGRAVLNELARGAAGTMPAVELLEMHVRLWALFQAGDFHGAYDLFEKMLPILNVQRVFRWALTKRILLWRGLIESDHVRVPGAFRLDEEDDRELRRLYDRVKNYVGAG